MSLRDVLAKMKLSQGDAEVIFDRDEPIGRTTDLVMPRRRWFRRSNVKARALASQPTQFPAHQS